MLANRLRRTCVALVSVSLLSVAMPLPARAAIVTTDEAIAVELRSAHLETIRAGLAREDVESRMVALGVDPASVEQRLDALTATELADLAARIDSAPAGGDALAVIGILFLVLLILEYTGAIDIFKKVP